VTQSPAIAAKQQPAAIAAENIPAKKQPDTTQAASSATSASNRPQQQPPQPSPGATASSNAPNLAAKNTQPPATTSSNAPGPVAKNIPAPANVPAPKPSDIQTKRPAPADSNFALQAVVLPPNTNPPALPEPSRADSSQPASQPKPPANAEIVKGTVSVSASPFPSIRVPPELKSQISKQGASLQIGQLLSRVEPAYPEDAERQRIEGVVKLHAIIARDGTIQDIDQMSGPPLLVAAAANAVRQWRYKPTSLDGHPVEATESVTVTFRLQSTHPN
jgi:TonB family protein